MITYFDEKGHYGVISEYMLSRLIGCVTEINRNTRSTTSFFGLHDRENSLLMKKIQNKKNSGHSLLDPAK